MRQLRPVSGLNPWGPVPDGGHRDMFKPGALRQEQCGARAQRGATRRDGRTDRPELLARLPMVCAVMLVTSSITFWLNQPIRAVWAVQMAWFAGLATAAWMLARVTSSTCLAIAATSHGIALFRSAALTNRSGRTVGRLPAAWPVLVRTTGSWRKVDLGDRIYWVGYRADPLLRWMAYPLRSVPQGLATT